MTAIVISNALACLYAADCYHPIEIEPYFQVGRLVISDRYIASGLVVQRFDGVDLCFLWSLNARARRPGLAVILEANPTVIAERLEARGPHNRYQLMPDRSRTEVAFYREAASCLQAAGYTTLRIDCSSREPQPTAATIRDSPADAADDEGGVLMVTHGHGGETPHERPPGKPSSVRRPAECNGDHGYLLPDDGTYHEDKRLIADLADLNTQVGRYVLEHISADAGNSAPASLSDEHRLGIELVRVGVRVIERADRRRRVADEQRPANVDRQAPT